MILLRVRRRMDSWRKGAVKKVLVSWIVRRANPVDFISCRLPAPPLKNHKVPVLPFVPPLKHAYRNPATVVVGVKHTCACSVQSNYMRRNDFGRCHCVHPFDARSPRFARLSRLSAQAARQEFQNAPRRNRDPPHTSRSSSVN